MVTKITLDFVYKHEEKKFELLNLINLPKALGSFLLL